MPITIFLYCCACFIVVWLGMVYHTLETRNAMTAWLKLGQGETRICEAGFFFFLNVFNFSIDILKLSSWSSNLEEFFGVTHDLWYASKNLFFKKSNWEFCVEDKKSLRAIVLADYPIMHWVTQRFLLRGVKFCSWRNWVILVAAFQIASSKNFSLVEIGKTFSSMVII